MSPKGRRSALFIGEGTSDESVVPHIKGLCRLCGAEDPTEIIPDTRRFSKKVGHSVLEKVKAALELAPKANLLFIHRDADGRDPTPRYEEIAEAIESLGVSIPYVAVVPIQETEAWLLVDEEAIREVAGKPKGRMALNLPTPKQVENIANPKERLKDVLAIACGLKGRKLRKFKKDFPKHRRELLEQLDHEGPLSEVPAFKRLLNDISDAIEKLKKAHN